MTFVLTSVSCWSWSSSGSRLMSRRLYSQCQKPRVRMRMRMRKSDNEVLHDWTLDLFWCNVLPRPLKKTDEIWWCKNPLDKSVSFSVWSFFSTNSVEVLKETAVLPHAENKSSVWWEWPVVWADTRLNTSVAPMAGWVTAGPGWKTHPGLTLRRTDHDQVPAVTLCLIHSSM